MRWSSSASSMNLKIPLTPNLTFSPSTLERAKLPCFSRQLDKYWFLKETNFGHSHIICLTVKGTRQSSQSGGLLPDIKNPWVNRVWPIRRRHNTVSHFRGMPWYDQHGWVLLVISFILLVLMASHFSSQEFLIAFLIGR